MLGRFPAFLSLVTLAPNHLHAVAWLCRILIFASVLAPADTRAQSAFGAKTIENIFEDQTLTVLADVKHGVHERVAFFSSATLFEAMQRAGVRHVAIEMPRVLGRQAMGIDTEADLEAFVNDVVRYNGWHFTNPDNPGESSALTQRRIATALGRQVLHAKRLGIELIFYDFNNPLGGFRTFNDPVYRCLAELSGPTWIKYGLDGKITKDERDAAIMRERFSHDDELAAYIEQEVAAKGGGKLVIIPGYAHAALPGGIADRLEQRLGAKAAVVAVLKDADEDKAFHTFLWDQSRLLAIDLSRPPHFSYSIADGVLRREAAAGRFAALDGSRFRKSPHVCNQLARAE